MLVLIFALASAPLVSPPPLIMTVNEPPPSVRRQQSVFSLQPVEARCADGKLDISGIAKPAVQLVWVPNLAMEKPTTLNFRIDENGRVLGIKRDPASYMPFVDMSASLAASHFPPSKPRADCSVTYSPTQSNIAEAKALDLIEYSVFAKQRPPKELFDRVNPAGSNCYPTRPAVLLQAYPEFDRIPATAGRTDWSMVKFDIDAKGKPVAIGIHATSGNKALDKASINAIAKSRYAKAAKKGCLYPYWRAAGPVAAPERPDLAAYRDGEGKCPAEVEWKSKPALVYPDAFRRRAVEGWAIIAFDVAPWGATGNVKLVAAEPAAEFGEAALNIVRGATVASSEQGYSGCFEKVRYVMNPKRPDDDMPTD